ncbi:MAG: hypothetical protein ACE14W_07365, partial [Candidatus Velamenicoccus archaeovorus]
MAPRPHSAFGRGWRARLGLPGLLLAVALIAAACGGASASAGGGGGSDGLSLKIASPADGTTVQEPFTVRFDASVPIGDPSTGDHHVHLCFDGGSCDELSQSVIAYADSAEVSGLSPGMHTIEASLRNADHSDAGVTDTITVQVTGSGAATSGGPTPAGGGSSGS